MSITYYEPELEGLRTTMGCGGGVPADRLHVNLGDGVETRIRVSDRSSGYNGIVVDFNIAEGHTLQLQETEFRIWKEGHSEFPQVIAIRGVVGVLNDPASRSDRKSIQLPLLAPMLGSAPYFPYKDKDGKVEYWYQIEIDRIEMSDARLTVLYPRMLVNGVARDNLKVPFSRHTSIFVVVNC